MINRFWIWLFGKLGWRLSADAALLLEAIKRPEEWRMEYRMALHGNLCLNSMCVQEVTKVSCFWHDKDYNTSKCVFYGCDAMVLYPEIAKLYDALDLKAEPVVEPPPSRMTLEEALK